MNELLKGIGFSVSLCVGAYAISLGYTILGHMKLELSRTDGYVARGITRCIDCDENEARQVNGRFTKYTIPAGNVGLETKRTENGTISTDFVILGKVCDKSGSICGKAAMKMNIHTTPEQKKAPLIPYSNPLKEKTPFPNWNPQKQNSIQDKKLMEFLATKSFPDIKKTKSESKQLQPITNWQVLKPILMQSQKTNTVYGR